MTAFLPDSGEEPVIAVGLVEKAVSVAFRLSEDYSDASGRRFTAGEYQVVCRNGTLYCTGAITVESQELVLHPLDKQKGHFSLEKTIGIDFHWQQKEMEIFRGGLKCVPQQNNRVTLVNEVPLETYIISVICSEMSSTSPPELARAHSVISRSWLLAQLESKNIGESPGRTERVEQGEIIRWYDHQAHKVFDVCADDHCQRYQGTGRIHSPAVEKAICDTRGQVLAFEGKACDARFSKCCGGVTEDFRSAWSDTKIPYLVPVFDGPECSLPEPPLTDEQALRKFIANPPDSYCNCTDERILNQVLVSYDRQTQDFFRWQVKLSAHQASELIKQKLDLNPGRILSMEPVERGLSGRLKRLRLVGELGSVVVGKELEIRRALSPSHLYSSAFIIDTEGPPARPEAFILNGAGWGHGVGLCQIGAAAMAFRGTNYQDILAHYYPGTAIERFYE